MILYSRLRSSLVCLTTPEVDAMQSQLSLRMERIMDQYLALWRMEGRTDDDMNALYSTKHGELLSRTNSRRDEIAAKQCKDSSAPEMPRSSLRPPSAASSVADDSGSDDDDNDDSPHHDASIHPYTPPYAPTVPAIFTGLTEQDIRDRHRQPPPPPQADAAATEEVDGDDDDDDDPHDGDVGEVIGSITPMSLETVDGESDEQHFVASIAPQRMYHEDDDDNSSFIADKSNAPAPSPRSSRARLEAIQQAARVSER